jgi:hypothetical protein
MITGTYATLVTLVTRDTAAEGTGCNHQWASIPNYFLFRYRGSLGITPFG